MREHRKYILRKNKKIVYIGTSNNPERRCKEHLADKDFTSIQVVGNKTTEAGAKKWEANRLETYRRNHGGKNPKHNKKRNG